MKVTAVIPAAGSGVRFAGKKGQRKPFFILKRRPILIYTLLRLEGSGLIDDIIVVVHRGDVARCRRAVERCGLKKVSNIIPGAKTRFASVKKGLSFVTSDTAIVVIHDGVRPFVRKRLIADSIEACRKFGAAICGVPVVSTVKHIGRRSFVKGTLERTKLFDIQTPQVFKREIILKAYGRGGPGGACLITDDSILVERLGYKVKVVPGTYENIKITTPGDILLAKAFLKNGL